MTKILITGAGSYIGSSVETYLAQWPDQYQVDTLDMLDENWKHADFSGYDSVFHVAGIAHIRETEENAPLYYRVNRDMAIEAARKARESGVGQFIFLSSMSVYGADQGPVDPLMAPAPKSHYGKSKLQAEEGITPLRGEGFAVAVLRPPMVYGPGCKGNYRSLQKIAKIAPVFPDYENIRSMISMENLAAFVKQILDSRADGLFCPQDPEYVCTCRMIRDIAAENGRKMSLLKVLNPAVVLAKTFTGMGRKAFSDLYYTKSQGNEAQKGEA